MKTTTYILIFLIGLCGISRAQHRTLYPDLKILSSDENGVTLEFRPQYLPHTTIVADGNTFELPQYKYGVRLLNENVGSEDLKGRVIGLAVPGSSGNTVTVLQADYETESGFSLAPVPHVIPKDNLGSVERVYKPRFLSQQTFFPANIVSFEQNGFVKGWNTANIIISPFQYQSSTKTLRKYSRVVVRVDYGSRENNFDNSGSDEWAQVSLINYSAGKRWASTSSLRKTAAVNSVLASGMWYKLEVTEDGMYKIDATYLRSIGIEPSSLSSITDIKVFGSDGRNLPESLSAVRPEDLPQIAVEYTYGNNAQSNDDDYILFYGQGTRGWNYSPATKKFSHYINNYSNSNYYFLAVGANVPIKTMQQVSLTAGGGAKVTTALGKVFFKEERFNFNLSGQNWVCEPISAGGSKSIANQLPGLIQGTTMRYEYNLYSRANGTSTFTVTESGVQIDDLSFRAMSKDELDSPETNYAVLTYSSPVINSNAINNSDKRSVLNFTYSSNGTDATGFVDWARIFYQQQLTAHNDQVIFHSPDTSGFVDYQVNGFSSSDVAVFEIGNVQSARKINHQLEPLTGLISFRDSNATGSVKRYWIGTESLYKYPRSFVKIPNSNLHGFNGAEFVIIAPNEFKSEALRLKQHKESLPTPITTVVVDIDTLFNEFGAGISDPVAMRDFLKYATDQWTVKPKYVLFFGDASFDHKLILGNDRWWVPTIQTPESNSKIASYNIEDFFSYLNPLSPTNVSIAHGRLCARGADQAALLVDRIIDYETKSEKSTWKNTITIVADDLWSSPTSHEIFNTEDSETLASGFTPDEYEIKRIYTEEYPLVHASSGRRRPEARQAIIDQVNKGTLILNYAGHGNPKVWAHESILTLDDTKTQFTNNDRLTFVVAATCDWGRFDEAGEQSSAEEVMVNKNGGAIGVLSATRAVYAHSNAATNRSFYNHLLSSGNRVLALGDAYLLTKNELGEIVNKQKYFLLGDPTLRLAAPTGFLSLDSLNGKKISIADTLQALSKIILKATVRDTSNVKTAYNGTASITIFDAERSRVIPQIPSVPITENGLVIYKGEASIKNGEMTAEFIAPKDISYENKRGRISVYFSNAASDGRGYTTNFIVGGSNQQAAADSLGPKISIYFDNRSFRSGDVVNSSPTLIVEMHDSSGINSSANSIGHRLEAWIDGSSKSIDLTEYYKGTIDSYQSGTAEYQLTGLVPGTHTIKVRGWDVYNNSASVETQFFVAAGEGLSIYNVYNFPNPVRRTTTFTFQHNQLAEIDVEIKIYTVAGRLIHTIERNGFNDRFFKMDWDTRDKDGDQIGNGIYLYRVIAKTSDGKYSSEATGKLSIVR